MSVENRTILRGTCCPGNGRYEYRVDIVAAVLRMPGFIGYSMLKSQQKRCNMVSDGESHLGDN